MGAGAFTAERLAMPDIVSNPIIDDVAAEAMQLNLCFSMARQGPPGAIHISPAPISAHTLGRMETVAPLLGRLTQTLAARPELIRAVHAPLVAGDALPKCSPCTSSYTSAPVIRFGCRCCCSAVISCRTSTTAPGWWSATASPPVWRPSANRRISSIGISGTAGPRSSRATTPSHREHCSPTRPLRGWPRR